MSYTRTVQEEMLVLLRENEEARERKNKDRAIRHLLIKQYPSLRAVDKGVLQAAITRSQSLDRAWRKVTEENPELRGKDYNAKGELVRKTQHTLGYHV
jgi:hypothetical protein